ncbi:MAG TPA: hypothetical protein VIV65_06965 [Gemmatimonadaceae bacterium]
MTKLLLLSALALTGIAMGALPLAEAAECEAHVGNTIWAKCSSPRGACAAAAMYSASGNSGAGCMAADY